MSDKDKEKWVTRKAPKEHKGGYSGLVKHKLLKGKIRYNEKTERWEEKVETEDDS